MFSGQRVDNTGQTLPNSVFLDCVSLSSVELHDKIRFIYWKAFYGCSSLTSITIPTDIVYIDENCFQDCLILKEVIIHNSLVANSLSLNNSHGYLINYAETVYIKTGLSTESSTYLIKNFTKQATSDKVGYDMYLVNA